MLRFVGFGFCDSTGFLRVVDLGGYGRVWFWDVGLFELRGNHWGNRLEA